MENQYCKVGSTTHITSGSQASTRLASYYQTFANMAEDTRYSGTQLGEFFERKARILKKAMEELA
ncbi:MAG: hypothetical protein KJO16_10250 [Muriicola sp.]|nr:hypothetical protein [Muriicola sp.]NNK11483.1 hypothetical protein [Flavobacteriaceae bacterium]